MKGQYISRSRLMAQRDLAHYFKVIAQAAGVRCWDQENDAEIRGIVDSIIDAVKDELRHEEESSNA